MNSLVANQAGQSSNAAVQLRRASEAPALHCCRLPAFNAEDLDSVCATFARAEGCQLRQDWLPDLDPDFAPALVWVGWRRDSLMVFAELEDAEIFTRATAPNQRMWELGDVLEIFLSPENSASYVEFHVTPNNQRLQMFFPDTAALRQAQSENRFEHLLLSDGVFASHTWAHPEQKRWFVLAKIPARTICGTRQPLLHRQWRFSFSRYDYVRGRNEPVISSTSPHAQPDFHRREEWGILHFV